MINDLQRVASGTASSHVSQNTYRRLGVHSSTVIKTRFGSWNRALLAAGLNIAHRPNVTSEELFANLIAVWTKLGRQPRKREMTGPLSTFTADPYVNRFGGWLSAIKALLLMRNTDSKSVTESPPTQPLASRGPRDPSLRLRFRVMLRDNFRCRACGRSPATQPGVLLHVDHIHPWVEGGPTTYENLQTLCADCNLGKAALFVPKSDALRTP